MSTTSAGVQVFDQRMLDDYEPGDRVGRLLAEATRAVDRAFTSHRWLLESLPKRMIFEHLYGDLLEGHTPHSSVLDVGGGYTALTRLLLARHDYTLLDIMAHCPHDELRRVEAELRRAFWQPADWLAFVPTEPYDYIIANDIFPNVDQRLELFLEKYLPACREMRLSLTYYNVSRWYAVKRLDADEVFHMLAWDGERTALALRRATDQMLDLDELTADRPSLFKNQRQVAYVRLRGGAK